MRVLGIETSCDETSAAVVLNGRKVLSNVIHSQLRSHAPFGGVVPEIASREHVTRINGIVQEALSRARGLVDAIAVTTGPGLVGSLLVGKMTAQAMGWARGIPVIPVNHLEAHALSALLSHPNLRPPFISLVVSGGHTDLILVKDYGRYEVLGRTRDDAAGESFDKVANLLNLGYPGGPIIDRLARKGNAAAVRFPRPHMRGTWDFSFSGLKTAVLYYLRGNKTRASVPDICASFQCAVVDVLVEKTLRAAACHKLKSIAVGGGVSANSALRAAFASRSLLENRKVHFPETTLSTDNAAMIASVGYFHLHHASAGSIPRSLKVDPSLPIRSWR